MPIVARSPWLLLVVLSGCAASTPTYAPPSQPVAPPPVRNAPLPSGFVWPRSAGAFASARFLPGVVRPFDRAQVLASWSSRPRLRGACSPIQLSTGDLAIGTCGGLPLMRTSLHATRRSRAPRATTRSLALDGAPAAAGSYPPSIDLRGSVGDGPVKDQAMVGVCWSFALSSIMENALGRQGVRDAVAPLHLIVSDAWTSLHQRGTTDPMVSGVEWPYDPAKACKLDTRPDGTCEDAYHVKQGSWQADSTLHAEVDEANAHGAYSVTKVENIDPISFDAVAEVLATGVEAYLSVNIDDRAWSRPDGGVIADYADGNRGPHAVTVVGYRTSGPRGRELLIKNSWGPDWGDGGYAWLSEATLMKQANDLFTVEVTRKGGGGFNLPQPGPNNTTPNTNSPFGFPLPPGLPALPALPSIPGLPPIPGLPQQGQPNQPQPQPSTCASGQVQDILTRVCANPCANGLPPAAGFCAP